MNLLKHGFLSCGLAIIALTSAPAFAGGPVAGKEGGGGDISCQNRIEIIRNNLEQRLKTGGARTLNFAGTGVTAVQYSQVISRIIDLTRQDQSDISCTTNPNDVAALIHANWSPICAAKWLDGDGANLKNRTHPKILCYAGREQNGVYTGGLMGMSGRQQYGQIDHEFNVLAGFEDQKHEYSHYPISNQVSYKTRAMTLWLWPAVTDSLLNQTNGVIYSGSSPLPNGNTWTSETTLQSDLRDAVRFENVRVLDMKGRQARMYSQLDEAGAEEICHALGFEDGLSVSILGAEREPLGSDRIVNNIYGPSVDPMYILENIPSDANQPIKVIVNVVCGRERKSDTPCPKNVLCPLPGYGN